jgi:nitrile hydratase
MNGIHDMGGLHGFGKVEVEEDEPVFHARWEGRIYAMTQVLDTTGIYSLDEHRHEIELMPPQDYLRDGYYGRWLFAMESILDRNGILYPEDVERRLAERSHDANRLAAPAPGPLQPRRRSVGVRGATRSRSRPNSRSAIASGRATASPQVTPA